MLTERDFIGRSEIRSDFTVVIPVTVNSAYASGNVLGGPITIGNSTSQNGPFEEGGLSRILQSIAVYDPDAQSAKIDFFFFNVLPSTGCVDKAAFAPAVADLDNCLAVVTVNAADYLSAGAAGSVAAGANQANLGHVLKPIGNGATLYCVPVLRGTPTYVNGNVYLRLQFA